jgi:large subunit ribosomal protein L1
MNEKIINAIKELKEKSKKRKFSQTFDIIINLKEFDIKKPENKLNEEFSLPYGKGKKSNVVIFSDTLKNEDATVLTSDDLGKLTKNKRSARKIARENDFFLAEAKLMPVVGKGLGQFLAPRGKMPKIITEDVGSLMKGLQKSIRIRIKETPTIQCPIGNEDMKNEEIAENIESLLKYLNNKLPKGKHNIGEVLLKLTMSKPIKVEV